VQFCCFDESRSERSYGVWRASGPRGREC
jgi:hypothetical protein